MAKKKTTSDDRALMRRELRYARATPADFFRGMVCGRLYYTGWTGIEDHDSTMARVIALFANIALISVALIVSLLFVLKETFERTTLEKMLYVYLIGWALIMLRALYHFGHRRAGVFVVSYIRARNFGASGAAKGILIFLGFLFANAVQEYERDRVIVTSVSFGLFFLMWATLRMYAYAYGFKPTYHLSKGEYFRDSSVPREELYILFHCLKKEHPGTDDEDTEEYSTSEDDDDCYSDGSESD